MRHFRESWNLPPGGDQDKPLTWKHVEIAVLMDIRDVLDAISRKLSALECPNFTAIPATLRQIRRNTTKKKRVRK